MPCGAWHNNTLNCNPKEGKERPSSVFDAASKQVAASCFREPEATYKDSLSARDDYTLSTCKPVSEEENLDRENFYVASLGVIQDSVNRYHSKVWPDTLVNQDCICRRFAAK